MHPNHSKSVLAFAAAALMALAASAQPAAPAAAASPVPWAYKTKQLDRAAVDALLAKPQALLVIDVRRPDELISKGSFPVYLNLQVKDVEKSLAYIPRDRTILTVSNRAHRAGAVGDLLASKGYQVAGATGSLDYEEQGGKAVVRVPVPGQKPAVAAAR